MAGKWLKVALFNFFMAALLGLSLRYAFVKELSWLNYRYVVHGHSHVAMLGWLYLGLSVLIVNTFFPKDVQKSRRLKLLFWGTQISVVGMLFSFPLQGYGPVSIFFSTAHTIFSYLFVGLAFRHIPRSEGFAWYFLRAALLFMVLSTFALWAIAPIIVLQLKGTALYYAAIQFYLHFQFNGWFIFAALALFVKWMEQRALPLPVLPIRWFFRLLVLSTFLTYALALAWSTPIRIIFWTNSIGVLVQLAALMVLIKIGWPMRSHLPTRGGAALLFKIAFFCFAVKTLAQTAVALPMVATVAYTIRNYVIGFIHLILLGALTSFLLAYALQRKLLSLQSKSSQIGLILLQVGFLLSELLLFVQGTMFWAGLGFLPSYYRLVFLASCLIPIGLGLYLWAQLKTFRIYPFTD